MAKGIVLICLLFASCGKIDNSTYTEKYIHGNGGDEFYVITIESCEYVVLSWVAKRRNYTQRKL